MNHFNGAAFAALILNILLLVMEIYATILNFKVGGPSILRYYTILSNIMVGFSSAAYIAAHISKSQILWEKAQLLRYVATAMLVLTFLIVILVLAPLDINAGKNPAHYFIGRIATVHHVAAPIISFISFSFLETNESLKRSHIWVVMGVTILYTIIILILNIRRVMVGPYAFFHIYEQSLSTTVFWEISIGIFAYVLDFAVYWLGSRR